MDEVKNAFSKVKQDITDLYSSIESLKTDINEIKAEFKLIYTFLTDLKKEVKDSHNPADSSNIPVNQHITPTDSQDSAHNLPSEALKDQFSTLSIRNNGVPADRQTDQQTDQHIIRHIISSENPPFETNLTHSQEKEDQIDHMAKASEILNNLDLLKKEIRLKFKKLTQQEISVFSLLYSLEDQGFQVDYSLLAEKLTLTESSIRDYICKIQKKGIPVDKEKLNNKKIVLHISKDLKKIASLDTILRLREL